MRKNITPCGVSPRDEDVHTEFRRRKHDLLRNAAGEVGAKRLSSLQFLMLWYVYDRIWADGRLEFISGAQLVKRLGVSLRSARDGLRILGRRGFLRCLTRGGGRGVANAYRLGNGPGPEASNVVQLQSRERKHNQKRCSQLHRLRPKRCNQLHRLRPKTVQNAAPKRCSQLHTTTIKITTIEKREMLHAQRSVKTDPKGNLNGDR